MKIYVVTTGDNAITVSLNGEAAVAKTTKPTLTALGNGRILFECDGISEEVETYRHIFVNATPLKGSWIAEEDYLSVALFEAIMNRTFVSSGGGGSLDINGLDAADALDGTEEVPVYQDGSNKKTTTQDIADLGGGSVSIPATSYDNNTDAEAALGAGVLYKSTSLVNGSPIILITI